MKKTLNRVGAVWQVAKFTMKGKVRRFLTQKDSGEKNIVIEILFIAIGVICLAAIFTFVHTNWTTISTKAQAIIDTIF